MAAAAEDGDGEWTPPYAWRRRFRWKRWSGLLSPVITRRARQSAGEQGSKQNKALTEDIKAGFIHPSKAFSKCSSMDSPHLKPERNNSIAAIKHVFLPKATLMKRELLHTIHANRLPESKRGIITVKQSTNRVGPNKFSEPKLEQNNNFKNRESKANNHTHFLLKRKSEDIQGFPPKKKIRPSLSVTIPVTKLFTNTESSVENKLHSNLAGKSFAPHAAVMACDRSDVGKPMPTLDNVGMSLKNPKSHSGSENQVHDCLPTQQSELSTRPPFISHGRMFHPVRQEYTNNMIKNKVPDAKINTDCQCNGNTDTCVNRNFPEKPFVENKPNACKFIGTLGCHNKESTRAEDENGNLHHQTKNSRRSGDRNYVSRVGKLKDSHSKHFKVVSSLNRVKDIDIKKLKNKEKNNCNKLKSNLKKNNLFLYSEKHTGFLPQEVSKRNKNEAVFKENSKLKSGLPLNSCQMPKNESIIKHHSNDVTEKVKTQNSIAENFKLKYPLFDKFPIVLCQKLDFQCKTKFSDAERLDDGSDKHIDDAVLINKNGVNTNALVKTDKTPIYEHQLSFDRCKSSPNNTNPQPQQSSNRNIPQNNTCEKNNFLIEQNITHADVNSTHVGLTNSEYSLKKTSSKSLDKKKSRKFKTIKELAKKTKILSKIESKHTPKTTSKEFKLKVSLPLKKINIEQLILGHVTANADEKYQSPDKNALTNITTPGTNNKKIEDNVKRAQQSEHNSTRTNVPTEESVHSYNGNDTRYATNEKLTENLKGTLCSLETSKHETGSFNARFEDAKMKQLELKGYQEKKTNRKYKIKEQKLPTSFRAENLSQRTISSRKITHLPAYKSDGTNLSEDGMPSYYCIDKQCVTNGKLILKLKRLSCTLETPQYKTGVRKESMESTKVKQVGHKDPKLKNINQKHFIRGKYLPTSLRATSPSQGSISTKNVNDNSTICVKGMMKDVKKECNQSTNEVEENCIFNKSISYQETFNNENKTPIAPQDIFNGSTPSSDSSTNCDCIMESPRNPKDFIESLYNVNAMHNALGNNLTPFHEAVTDCNDIAIESLHLKNSLCGCEMPCLHGDTDNSGDIYYDRKKSGETNFTSLTNKTLAVLPTEPFSSERFKTIKCSSTPSNCAGSSFPVIESTFSLRDFETCSTVTHSDYEVVLEIKKNRSRSEVASSEIAIKNEKEIIPASNKMHDTTLIRDHYCSEESHKIMNDVLMERDITELYHRERDESNVDYTIYHEKVFDDYTNVLCSKMGDLLFDITAEENHFRQVNKTNSDFQSCIVTDGSHHKTFQEKIECFNRFFIQAFERICNITENEKERKQLLIELFVRIKHSLPSTENRTWTLNETRLQLITFLSKDVFHLPLVAGTFFKREEEFLQDCIKVIDYIRGSKSIIEQVKLKSQRDNIDAKKVKYLEMDINRENYVQKTSEPEEASDTKPDWENVVHEVQPFSFAYPFDYGIESHEIHRTSGLQSSRHISIDLKNGLLTIDTVQYSNDNLRIFKLPNPSTDRTTHDKSQIKIDDSKILIYFGGKVSTKITNKSDKEVNLPQENVLDLGNISTPENMACNVYDEHNYTEKKPDSFICNVKIKVNDKHSKYFLNKKANPDNKSFCGFEIKDHSKKHITFFECTKTENVCLASYPVKEFEMLEVLGGDFSPIQKTKMSDGGNSKISSGPEIFIKEWSNNLSLNNNSEVKLFDIKCNKRTSETGLTGKNNVQNNTLEHVHSTISDLSRVETIRIKDAKNTNNLSLTKSTQKEFQDVDVNHYIPISGQSMNLLVLLGAKGKQVSRGLTRESVITGSNKLAINYFSETDLISPQPAIVMDTKGDKIDSVILNTLISPNSLCIKNEETYELNTFNSHNTYSNNKTQDEQTRIPLLSLGQSKSPGTDTLNEEVNKKLMQDSEYVFGIDLHQPYENQSQENIINLPQRKVDIEIKQDNSNNKKTSNHILSNISNIKLFPNNISVIKTINVNNRDGFLEENTCGAQALGSNKTKNTVTGNIFLKPITELLINDYIITDVNFKSFTNESTVIQKEFRADTNLIGFEKSTNNNDKTPMCSHTADHHVLKRNQQENCIVKLESVKSNVLPLNPYCTISEQSMDGGLSAYVPVTRNPEVKIDGPKQNDKFEPSTKVYRSFRKELMKNYLMSTSEFSS